MSICSPEELSALGLKPEELTLITQRHPEIRTFETILRLSELAGHDIKSMIELAPVVIEELSNLPESSPTSFPNKDQLIEMYNIFENTIS